MTQVYWIQNFNSNARLGIMPRPRGNEWLEDEIVHFKSQNVGVLVSLLTRPEANELGLQQERLACESHGIEFLNFPIPDVSVPASTASVKKLMSLLKQKLDDGTNVVIHCRMGIGRSSIIAGCVLLLYGFKSESALAQISAKRGLRVPDSNQQASWLKAMETELKNG